MNDNAKNQGQPKNQAKRNQPRQGQPKHVSHQRGQEKPQGKVQRDSSTLGLRTNDLRGPIPSVDCAICGKTIFDLAGAIADKDSGAPIHFDCAFERLTASEPLAAGEKIVYLGAGCFGVVIFKNGADGAFVVTRRIRWEEEGKKQPWRKDISSYITKI